jgi:hypothetical protein
MLKGLEEILEKTQEVGNLTDGERIRRLTLRDGESALIRFISDGNDVVKAYMHNLEKDTPRGRKFVWQYCTKNDTDSCPECSGGGKAKGMLYLWVYVYTIMHRGQNPELDNNPDADRWSPVKVGNITYYKEDVNTPRIFSLSVGRANVYQNKLIGFWQENGTLTDRDYKFSRMGSKLDTTYDLIPKDKAKKSKEVAAFTLENLPSVSDYVTGKNYAMNPTGDEAVEENGNGKGESEDLF